MKIVVIGIVAILVLVALVTGGMYAWKKLQEPEPVTTGAGVPENVLGGDVLDVSESEGSDGIVPEIDASGAEDVGEVEVSVGGDLVAEGSDEDIVPDAAEGSRAISQPIPETPRETRPAGNQPGKSRPERTSGGTSDITAIEVEPLDPTPTPAPPTPTPKPIPTTPAATPTPSVPVGNYSVHTTVPVLESALPQIRSAMKNLRIRLREERSGRQRLQAYRVAIGYFRVKSEATSWAKTYLKPKRISSYIYPVQGMYSIQVGVFKNRQNVDRQIRKLYQQFPGWRLPVRTEMTTLDQATFYLSIRRITAALAKRVQSELGRLGIQAELVGG